MAQVRVRITCYDFNEAQEQRPADSNTISITVMYSVSLTANLLTFEVYIKIVISISVYIMYNDVYGYGYFNPLGYEKMANLSVLQHG